MISIISTGALTVNTRGSLLHLKKEKIKRELSCLGLGGVPMVLALTMILAGSTDACNQKYHFWDASTVIVLTTATGLCLKDFISPNWLTDQSLVMTSSHLSYKNESWDIIEAGLAAYNDIEFCPDPQKCDLLFKADIPREKRGKTIKSTNILMCQSRAAQGRNTGLAERFQINRESENSWCLSQSSPGTLTFWSGPLASTLNTFKVYCDSWGWSVTVWINLWGLCQTLGGPTHAPA